MSEEQLKSYYAIIPANVRYDPDLTPNAKLLYGEITALTSDKGYCWASNNYFAKLYQVSDRSIRDWLNKLEEKKYIHREYVYKENSKEIAERKITIAPTEEFFLRYGKKVPEGAEEKKTRGTEKNFLDNNTSINNTFNNTYYTNKELNDLFIDFLKMRKQLKAVNSERAINSLLNTLSKYDDNTKYKMIENSITNSWKGVFPLKKERIQTPTRIEEVPDWLNKNIEDDLLSPEEQAKLENGLKKEDDFETRRSALQERLRSKYGKTKTGG